MATAIDNEGRAILAQCAERADAIVAANRDVIEAMASALDEAASLEGEAVAGFLSRVRPEVDEGKWTELNAAGSLALAS